MKHSFSILSCFNCSNFAVVCSCLTKLKLWSIFILKRKLNILKNFTFQCKKKLMLTKVYIKLILGQVETCSTFEKLLQQSKTKINNLIWDQLETSGLWLARSELISNLTNQKALISNLSQRKISVKPVWNYWIMICWKWADSAYQRVDIPDWSYRKILWLFLLYLDLSKLSFFQSFTH